MDNKMQDLFRKWLHIALGCMVTAAGLILLKHSHIVTGGTAGLALSMSYLFQTKFHYMFMLLNIPFFIFSFFSIGRTFTLRTIISISLLSAMTSVDHLFPDFSVPSLAGSIVGGAMIGVGISSLFKHGASLGGSTILALFLQRKYQWDPGRTNFVFDFLVVLTSFSAISLNKGLISVVSIAVTSGIISLYKNRYSGARRSKQSTLSTAATT
jgi:uncharacterized membrane-anchored protein YitT (DUF2179 family)